MLKVRKGDKKMADWCQTSILLKCKDHASVKEIFTTFMCFKLDDHYDGMWEHDLIVFTDHNPENFSVHRGEILEITSGDKDILIDAEEAYTPNIHFWQEFCKAEFGDKVKTILYAAEERDNEIYITNDPEVVDNYVVDIVNGDVEYFEAKEHAEVVKLLCELLIKRGPKDDPEFNVNEIISIVNEDSEFVDETSLAELAAKYNIAYVHKFEYCSIEDCC
jgi:hypothetical protein